MGGVTRATARRGPTWTELVARWWHRRCGPAKCTCVSAATTAAKTAIERIYGALGMGDTTRPRDLSMGSEFHFFAVAKFDALEIACTREAGWRDRVRLRAS
jgi:hypothetical protein